MRFSESYIQQVLDANNLVDLISETTQLKPSSGGYMGRCPFPDHVEKTPSFSVSEVKQVYHCFGCQKSGNLIRFMREYHGMTFPEAIEFLATRAQIPLPVKDVAASSEEERRNELRRQVLKANELAQQYFREQLKSAPENHPARQYLKKRGLADETLETFGVGFLGSAWDGLANFLKNRGVTVETAETAGLIRRRRDGSGHYDLFRERILYPIRKISGEVIGFGGRIIDKGEPKYLNSPETPVFHKGKTLYGLDQTARYIRSEDRVILVEGYMDLIALYQAGIRNVTATLGTALTLDHAWAITKMTPNITVLFDGDAAGQNAAEKSLPILLQAGLRPKGLILPDGLDPDDFLKERGAEAMNQALDAAPDLFNLILFNWTLNFRGAATEKLALIEKTQPIFEGMHDARLREMYLRDLAQKLQMPLPDLKRALSESGRNDSRTRSIPAGNTVLKGQLGSGTGSNAQGATGSGMGPGAQGSHSGGKQNQGQESNPSMQSALAPEDEQPLKFTVKGMSKAEKILLSVVLKNRANFEFFHQQNLVDFLSTESVRQIFAWIAETSRLSPERFDRLAGLLTELVDDASVVFESEKIAGNQFPADDDGAKQAEFESELLRDCVRRIRADGLKRQIDRVTQDLRIQSSPEKLELLMRLQRERMSLMQGLKISLPKDGE